MGLQDLRFAKAEYIRALKELRSADAALQLAKAAVEQANARYRDAETKWMEQVAANQALLNEYQELMNQAREDSNAYLAAEFAAKIAALEMEMEELGAQHAINMKSLERQYELSKDSLRVTLRNIALYSQALTKQEAEAVMDATKAYEKAFLKVDSLKIVVMKDQWRVDSLKMEKERFTDTVWDNINHKLVNFVDYYEKQIEIDRVEQAVAAALLLVVPEEDAQMKEWAELLETFDEDSTRLAYEKAQVEQEFADYFVTYVHDGAKAFNDSLKVWQDEVGAYPLPAWFGEEQLDTLANPLTQDDFKMGGADTIKMPVLKVKANATYAKFQSMLDSLSKDPNYNTVDDTPWQDANGNNIVPIKKEGSEIHVYANQAMKDFIIGTDKGTKNSQVYTEKNEDGEVVLEVVADYGLDGIYSVLDRKDVTDPDKIVDYKKKAEQAKNQWTLDRDSLAKVYKVDEEKLWSAKKDDAKKAFDPYKEALDAKATADANLTTAKANQNTEAAKLLTAAKNLRDALGAVHGKAPAAFDGNDSLQIFSTMIEFAKQRDAFLAYKPYGPTGKDNGVDSTKFYRCSGTVDGKAQIDSSAKISALTYADFRKGTDKYNKYLTDAQYDAGEGNTANAGLANIANQLLSNTVAKGLQRTTVDTAGFCAAMQSIFNTYEIDNPLDPKNVTYKGGDAYKTAAVKAAEAAVDVAAGNVTKAVTRYENLYKRYWGVSAYPTTGKELNPECYAEATFTEPFVITDFDGSALSGAKLIWTPGLGAVLGSVDPNKTADATGANFNTGGFVVNTSAIFGTAAQSDFFKYMFYLSKSEVKDEQSMKEIKEWIDGVKHAFALDAEGAAMPDVEAYEAYEERYEELSEMYGEFIAWMTGLVYYTGVDENGDPNGWIGIPPTVTNPFYHISQPNVPAGTASLQILGKNILGQYIWAENLGGRELAVAQELFPELPDVMNEYTEEIDGIRDQEDHLFVLSKAARDVYFAAAKVEGYQEMYVDTATLAPATNIDELITNYKNAREEYIETLLEGIAELEEEIDMYEHSIATFKSGVPAINILIAEAEQVLARDKEQLKKWNQVLSTAQENLDRIIEYLKSLDVNFVLHADELNY